MKNFIRIFCYLFTISIYAQPGSVDTTFGIGGKVLTNFGTNSTDQIHSIAIQQDQKIVAAGWSNGDFAVTRYNIDGSLDESFGLGGKVTTSFGNPMAEATSLAIQSNGKIVLAGIVYSGYDNNDIALVRYNNDGSLDSTFDSDGKVITSLSGDNERALSLVLQNDGKLLVAGSSENASMNNEILVLRYNNNGSLDSTFNSLGYITTGISSSNTWARSIVLQENGKIIIAGARSGDFINSSDIVLVSYNENGRIDSLFGTNGIVISDFGNGEEGVSQMKIQNDGKIVVAGWTSRGDGDFTLTRYKNDGTLDNTFGINGQANLNINKRDYCLAMTIQDNEKILMAGWTDNYYMRAKIALVCYNSDGTLDNDFGTGGVTTTDVEIQEDEASSIAVQADGKIVLGGSSYYEIVPEIHESDFILVRYNSSLLIGINEKDYNNSKVNIYPNPSTGTFTLNLNKPSKSKICIHDVLGNCIMDKEFQNEENLSIDLSDEAKGIYFLEVIVDNEKSVKKVVLQ